MAKLFLVNGANTLEKATILEMMNSRNGKNKAFNVANELKSCSRADLEERMKKRLKDFDEVYLVGEDIPTADFAKQADDMFRLIPSGVAGGMSLISQVANRANHRMSFHEEMVSLFAKGYIPALLDSMALRRDEIENLAMRDRALRGVTAAEEGIAAVLVQTEKASRLESTTAVSRMLVSTTHPEPGVERAIIDYAFLSEAQKSPVVIFVRTQAALVYSIRVFCASKSLLGNAREELEKLGFSFTRVSEPVMPGLYHWVCDQIPRPGKMLVPTPPQQVQKICTLA